MAEETKPEIKPEAAAIDTDKLTSGIVNGIVKGLGELRAQDAPAPQPVYTAPAAIADVDDADIDAAIEAGDKAKANALRKQQRLAMQQKMEREVDARLAQGARAIGQLSEQSVATDPHFKKYEKEIRAEMDAFKRVNPNALVTSEHWNAALNLVRGRHANELEKEAAEAAIRQQRDASAAPVAAKAEIEPETEPEPTTLVEAFGAGFQARFKEKQRAVGVRSEDEEVRQFDRWFRNKMPNNFQDRDDKGRPTKFKPVETVADYIKEARELEKIREEDPSFGLGS